ncbi:hypothetical protein ACPOL_0318 [Acidisarcina polymorpha]|uniref:Uncharacterized protein n=2 Tax=Acidisarcina polymorpha TaxID=2211140 RepID=A0A2Z5FSB5_9BACT|nr:hypothetical protein ACPOL_0318 [Acidisarcina polymorpha]
MEAKTRGFELAFFLQHLRIDVRNAPLIKLSGISTAVKNVSLSVDAAAQVWIKYPHWVCTRDCNFGGLGFCCEGHFEDRWDLLQQTTIGDFYMGADGHVNLEVRGQVVYGLASFDKLFIDYPILREINLAAYVIQFFKIDPFQIVDARSLVAVIPYANTRYQISSIALKGKGEIRAELTLAKL